MDRRAKKRKKVCELPPLLFATTGQSETYIQYPKQHPNTVPTPRCSTTLPLVQTASPESVPEPTLPLLSRSFDQKLLDVPLPSTKQKLTIPELRDMLHNYNAHTIAQAGHSRHDGRTTIPTGIKPLDNVLAGHGIPVASTIDCLFSAPGAGATRFALQLAAAVQKRSPAKKLALIDSHHDFYPPAVVTCGIDLQNLLVIRPANIKQSLWAAEQCLRCFAIAATILSVDRLNSTRSRRLQLAAEAGGGVGLILSTTEIVIQDNCRLLATRDRSFAAVRFFIEPLSDEQSTDKVQSLLQEFPTETRKLRITPIRIREAKSAAPFTLELADESGFSNLSAPVLHRTAAKSQPRTAAG